MIKPVDPRGRHNKPDNQLRKRQRRNEINDEVRLEIPPSDSFSIHHELASAEHSGARVGSDETRPELDENVEQVEEVGDGSEERDDDSEVGVGSCARVVSVSADGWDEEVQRVDEESEHAREDEEPVPFQDDLASWIENGLVPWEFRGVGLVVSVSSDSIGGQEVIRR